MAIEFLTVVPYKILPFAVESVKQVALALEAI